MPYTYTHGYILIFTRSLTKADYINLCGQLSDVLNTLYGITDPASLIHIRPEPITEGGFVFRGGPNGMYDDANDGDYDYKRIKTMRHPLGMQEGTPNFPWPRLPDNVEIEWSTSQETVIPTGLVSDTFLKALYGVPVWTWEELRVFQNVFLNFGINTRGGIPSQARLSTDD